MKFENLFQLYVETKFHINYKSDIKMNQKQNGNTDALAVRKYN